MIESKPMFQKKNVWYEREEKEGFWTYTSAVHPETRELIINATSKEILSLCDGRRFLGDIEKEIKSRYPEVDFKKIKFDVDSVIASFSRLGLIEWVGGDNPFLYKKEEPISRDISLMIAQENDINRIIKFIESSSSLNSNDYFCYRSPTIPPNDYRELALRQKLFFYAEEFFLLLNKGEIIGLISIGMQPGLSSTTATIKLIFSPKEYFVRLLHYAQDNAPIISIMDFIKLRLFELTKNQLNPELKKLLLKEGYAKEGILKNEFGFGNDVEMLAYCYDKKLIEKHEEMRKKVMITLIEKS